MIIQTQVVPKTLSSKNIKYTWYAGVYFGAIVIIIKGMGSMIKHIKDRYNIWTLVRLNSISKGSAYNPARIQPIKQAGTKSISLKYLTSTPLAPINTATVRAIKSPKRPEEE